MSPIGQIAETSMRDADTSRLFLQFFLMPKHAFYLKKYLIMGKQGKEEHRETPSTLGCSGIGQYLAVRASYEI